MKKLICAFFVVTVFSIGVMFCAGISNPKKFACEEACKVTYDKCKESAGADKVKTAACDVGFNECNNKCD